jgi:hypothetical protein
LALNLLDVGIAILMERTTDAAGSALRRQEEINLAQFRGYKLNRL